MPEIRLLQGSTNFDLNFQVFSAAHETIDITGSSSTLTIIGPQGTSLVNIAGSLSANTLVFSFTTEVQGFEGKYQGEILITKQAQTMLAKLTFLFYEELIIPRVYVEEV